MPYPIGFDTIRYISSIQGGQILSLGIIGFLKDPNLFYAVAFSLSWLSGNVFATFKFLGPLLLGILSTLIYFYANRALGWSNRKSFLVSLLISTYFISLRISWDLYRQMLGTIFLVATFIVLKSFNSSRRYYVAGFLMVLAVMSNEFSAVLLFFIIGLEAVGYLLRKARKDFVLLLASTSVSASLFFFQRFSHQVALPTFSTASEPSIGLFQHVIGLFFFMYILILPLVIIGLLTLKDSVLRYWVILCVGIQILTIVNPNESLLFWNRWASLLVYPFVFFAVEGFGRIWRFWSNSKRRLKSLIPKAFVITYLFSLLTLSGYYLTTTPENAFPYYSQYNPYMVYIPSSMLQTTISVNDSPSIVQCLKWLNENMSESSVIVSHYALYDWFSLYLPDKQIINTPEVGSTWTQIQTEAALADAMVELARNSSASGHDVYTVWWINGLGWYQIPSLPSDFKEVYVSGRMAVFSYVAQV